jgi:hypothetical protein
VSTGRWTRQLAPLFVEFVGVRVAWKQNTPDALAD